jgi:hypothetical protein
MGILSLILCIFTTYIYYIKDATVIALISLGMSGLNLWSFLIMYKFRNNKNKTYKLFVLINLITTIIALSLLIISLIKNLI